MNVDLSVAWKTVRAMIEGFIAILPNLVIGIVVFVLFVIAAKWAERGVSRLVRRRRETGNSLDVVMGRLMRWAVIILGLIVVLAIVVPTFEAGDMIAGLGVMSVAVGFAFKDILQNFLAGVLLLIARPFRIGDPIQVGDILGSVEEIQTRATIVKTFDGNRIVVPNAKLYTETVTVLGPYENRRWEIDVGVSYDADLAQAKRLILEAVQGTPDALAEPAPGVWVREFGESSINLKAQWWTKSSASGFAAVENVVLAVKRALDAAGIEIPFPYQTLTFKQPLEMRRAAPANGEGSRLSTAASVH